ncbi:MAG: DNA methyltransferase [Planctomycetaceae bacterium]
MIHEDAIKVGGATKAPDYCFRVGGTRKFFVEAKKPGVNLKNDPLPAYQLRRYGWSAKLPLCILTDFEEFAVYDCRKRPDAGDKAAVARTMYLSYTDFADRWDDVAGVFSREAVLKGSFDKYADSSKKKRGTAEVDDAFLAEIEGWRDLLAKNIALRNPDLGVRDLNYAVQKTIDRLVFLRICEDRGIEEYGRLQALQNGAKVYARLTQLFEAADDRYNSGLFHFHKEKNRAEPPDEWTLSLAIDDKPLKEIIRHLYYPDSPYEFSVLPADILGQVYERFLGKVIRLTAGGSAKVEEKPEVRKAGGVYYTPTYIVDYIVENTVGTLLDGAKVVQVERRDRRLDRTLRVLDPACGSGSFLLVAYQKLLDWHLAWYLDHDPDKLAATASPPVHRDAKGAWRLTTAERKRILLDHVYGVDIDAQAVEVTKLSLLLKVLEGETRETLQRQLFAKERALPDLAENIKCGNSLIGSDFYRDKQLALFDEEEQLRINAFDWEMEFAEIMSGGGFDAVIGNPPYLYSAGKDNADYFASRYQLGGYQTDYYVYFIEKALNVLRNKGLHSFIVTDSWLNAEYFSRLRNHLLSERRLISVAVFDFCVFKAAAIENSIYVCKSGTAPSLIDIVSFSDETSYHVSNSIEPKDALKHGAIDPRWSRSKNDVVLKLEEAGGSLKQFLDINRGLHAYRTDGYGLTKFGAGPQTMRDKNERSYHAESVLDDTYLPEIKGRNVERFNWECSGHYISYGEWLAEPRTPAFFFQEKIVLRKVLGRTLHGAIIAQPAAIDQALYICIPRHDGWGIYLPFFLGVMLSKIGAFYLRTKYSIYDRLYPWYTIKQLSAFPVHDIRALEDDRMQCASRIGKRVSNVMSMNSRSRSAKTSHQRAVLQRQVEATEREIDALVYQLYGLTDAEIAIVEAATG